MFSYNHSPNLNSSLFSQGILSYSMVALVNINFHLSPFIAPSKNQATFKMHFASSLVNMAEAHILGRQQALSLGFEIVQLDLLVYCFWGFVILGLWRCYIRILFSLCWGLTYKYLHLLNLLPVHSKSSSMHFPQIYFANISQYWS